MSKVSIVKYDGGMSSSIRKAIELIRPINSFSNKNVIIKVNACRPGYAPGQVTNPEFLRTTLEVLREYTSDITVCESDGQRFSAWDALEKSGIKRVALDAGARVISLSESRKVTVKVPNPLHFKEFELLEPLLKRDVFINMCLMKTHKLTEVSLGLKNLFGCISDYDRLKMHRYINELLPDIASVLRPDISLMDAIVAMEGDGPWGGIPKRMDLVLCSNNVVALDYVASQIMGFDPERIRHVINAIKKLPIEPIHIYGCPLDEVRSRFKPSAYDLLSKIERVVQKRATLARIVYLNPRIYKAVKWTGWKLRDLTGYTKDYERRLEESNEGVGLYDMISE